MNTEFPIKIDILHALTDFLDAYDNHAEMVVTEAIANAIDVGATDVTITLNEDVDGVRTISFHNNGPSMNKMEFDNYHVLARSSKSKGKGIGFAGIGAKVYLAAWTDTVIHTETTGDPGSFSSDMYVKNGELTAKYITSTITKPGTFYSVRLKLDDYNYLEKSLCDILIDTFSPAITNGLQIYLDGEKIRAWNPQCELNNSFTVSVNDKKFPVQLRVTEDDIPDHKSYFQYHVSGKIITTKKPEWAYQVIPAYKKRIHVYVDALEIADQLNLNKTNFKTGHGNITAPIFKEINRRVFELLKKKKYIESQGMEKWERTELTKFFEKLFKDPEYAFLNPDSRGGHGTGEGRGTGGRSGGSGNGKGGSGTTRNDNSRGGGSFSIGFVPRENDPREGWLDPATNKIMINMDHPLFIKYEKSIQARNQRIGAILTSVLIKNATTKKSIDTIEAFDLQSKLLTLAKDVMW